MVKFLLEASCDFIGLGDVAVPVDLEPAVIVPVQEWLKRL